MELLIKIGNNVDDRVHCLNTACRHTFKDALSEINKCPICNCEFLERRQNNCWQNGDIIDVHIDGKEWSLSEKLQVVALPQSEVQKLMAAKKLKTKQELAWELRRPAKQDQEPLNIINIDRIQRSKYRRKYMVNVSPLGNGNNFKEITVTNIVDKEK